MKTIIAGSRGITRYAYLLQAIELSGFDITEVVSGTCRGPDRMGERYAADKGLPIKRFPADWDRLGKSAGFVRNLEMAKYADACIVLWDGKSRGTKHMIDITDKQELDLMVYVVED